MKNYKTVIIGCGAAGCMCALSIKSGKVAIIDKATKPFKKILVTGNGRCNLTNLNISSEKYNCNIDRYLDKFDVKQTLAFFEKLGLEWFADDEGRVYPLSNQAKSVQDVVVNKLNEKADLYLGQSVVDIQCKDNIYIVTTEQESFCCDNVVVATGGNTMGEILGKLKINTKQFTPSLVALKCNNLKDLNGVRIDNVKVTLSSNGTTKSEIGEVLFKDQGVSGIAVFNMSTLLARCGNYTGKISIDLMPNVKHHQLIEKLKTRSKLDVNLDKMFVGMFNNALSNEIFRQAKTNTNKLSTKLTSQEIETLANVIKNLTFNISGCYDNNQVFSGGVGLDQLTDSLMSKQYQGLYFVGEVCDVDGECGGYNLQWAWTSGHIVGDIL